MTKIPFDRIAKANKSLERYHFRIENIPGFVYDGDIDLVENRQYVQIGLLPGVFPQAEIFWIGEKGYGRLKEAKNWFNIRGKPFPNYLEFAIELLKDADIVSVIEEGPFWLIEIHPSSFPLRDDPDSIFRNFLGHPEFTKKKEFLERLIKLSRSFEVILQMRISLEDYLIYGLNVQSQVQANKFELNMVFNPSQIDVPKLPDEALKLISPDIEISPQTLMLYLPYIAGWVDDKTHGPWAQRAIQLIQDKEAILPVQDRKYTEIYHPTLSSQAYTENVAIQNGKPDSSKHHPIVLGAVYEDCTGWKDKQGVEKGMPDFYDNWFSSDTNYKNNKSYYFSQKPYKRYYHHFGGKEIGLEYAWYFYFAGYPPTTKPGDRYYSARDWGYGSTRINENLNRLTFTQAIKQYNRYSEEGKRNAFLMLGHVIHLLQDVGQPDHAWLVPHPGSSMNEVEAYDRYHYCTVLAAEAAAVACAGCGIFCPICSSVAFGSALIACEATADKNEMGYEKLIAEKWNLSQVEKQIKNTKILPQSDYDKFFYKLSDFSKSISPKKNSPLGCSSLILIPPIPGADPDIQSDSPAKEPYIKITNKIVPQIIGSCAGLMQYFYEIVNSPPYVERVAIVQWEVGAKPKKFAFFDKKQSHCLRYDAEWIMSKNVRTLKYNVKSQPLSLDRPAYIFILFGPTKIGPEKGGRLMKQAELSLIGTYPLTGKPIKKNVQLNPGHDNDVGQYYWGSFDPHNCANDPYTLTLFIQGRDNAAHLSASQRNPRGDEIDAKPSTIAYVDPSIYPSFPWKDYKPGPDLNHKITIVSAKWTLFVNPYGLIVINLSQKKKAEVMLQIKEKAWDCYWEPYWGPLNCPIRWELLPQVTKLGTPPIIDSWEKFKFNVKLIVQRFGDAKLVITPDWQSCTPGQYEIKVLYKVGEPQYIWSNLIKILVEIL